MKVNLQSPNKRCYKFVQDDFMTTSTHISITKQRINFTRNWHNLSHKLCSLQLQNSNPIGFRLKNTIQNENGILVVGYPLLIFSLIPIGKTHLLELFSLKFEPKTAKPFFQYLNSSQVLSKSLVVHFLKVFGSNKRIDFQKFSKNFLGIYFDKIHVWFEFGSNMVGSFGARAKRLEKR